MRDIDLCGLPYVRNGDVTDCRLSWNHDLDCTEANHREFIRSLAQRQAAAYDRWVF